MTILIYFPVPSVRKPDKTRNVYANLKKVRISSQKYQKIGKTTHLMCFPPGSFMKKWFLGCSSSTKTITDQVSFDWMSTWHCDEAASCWFLSSLDFPWSPKEKILRNFSSDHLFFFFPLDLSWLFKCLYDCEIVTSCVFERGGLADEKLLKCQILLFEWAIWLRVGLIY